MYPVLFEIFGYPFHTYSMMIAIGCVTGIWLAARHADKIGVDRNLVLDLCWWLVVGGLLGARIVYMIVNWQHHWYPCVDFEYYNLHYNKEAPLTESTCLPLFNVLSGGLVFYGAFIGGFLTLWWFSKKHHIKLLPMADILMPSFAMGQFFGRLGCFGASCCWGKRTELPWGVHFPNGSMPFYQQWEQHLIKASDTHALGIHPTQLYDATYGLGLYFFLSWLRDRKKYDGQVFIWWLFAYPLLRSFVEIFRGDSERGFVFKYISEPLNQLLGLPTQSVTFLSTSQFISLIIVVLAGSLLIYLDFYFNRKSTKREESLQKEEQDHSVSTDTIVESSAVAIVYQTATQPTENHQEQPVHQEVKPSEQLKIKAHSEAPEGEIEDDSIVNQASSFLASIFHHKSDDDHDGDSDSDSDSDSDGDSDGGDSGDSGGGDGGGDGGD
jgi:phosphatidylglycerol:prolipoprotein diacylglycerol transferase